MAKIKVYATCFWESDISLLSKLKLYGFGKTSWKNLEFVVDDSFDIAIILTAPWKEHLDFDRKKSVRFLTEPPMSNHHKDVSDIVCSMYLPLPWWISSNSRDIIISSNSLTEKNKLISAVTSELYYMDGHKKRIQFLRMLDKMIDGDLDIYGKKYSGIFFDNMRHYKGEISDKYDGLNSYCYHIASENSFIPDYFTEKILDPICAESLCFYSGCTNITNYVDERAFINIDIENINIAINSIITAIKNNEYRKRLPFIVKEKHRILHTLNPLNIIWATLNDYDVNTYFKL